jgi:hypothetical protein
MVQIPIDAVRADSYSSRIRREVEGGRKPRVPAFLKYHFGRSDAEFTQNGQEASRDGPAPGHRRPIAYETAPSHAGISVAQNNAAAQSRSFATVLAGCGDLLQEAPERILNKTDFRVASVTSLDQLTCYNCRPSGSVWMATTMLRRQARKYN